MNGKEREKKSAMPPPVVPVFGSNPPPVGPRREVDWEEDWVEDLVSAHRPFPVIAPEARRPSWAQAAFRLGHLGQSIWNWADVLWHDLSTRNFTRPSARAPIASLIPRTSALHEARRALADSIPSPAHERLAAAIDSFAGFGEAAISRYRDGTFDPEGARGGLAPWEELWNDLVHWCELAVPGDRPLRPLFDLGLAFGRFSRCTNHFYEHFYDTQISWADKLPKIGEMARLADSIREDVLTRSPLLDGLARIGRQYERLGHPRALLIYHRAYRSRWTNPTGKLIDFKTIGDIDLVQARAVEADLADVPDAYWIAVDQAKPPANLEGAGPTSPALVDINPSHEGAKFRLPNIDVPRWDRDHRQLWYKGNCIRKIDSKGENIEIILDYFEDKGWIDERGYPLRLENPFPPNRDLSPAKRLRDANKTLNRKIAGSTIKFNMIESNSVTWTRIHT